MVGTGTNNWFFGSFWEFFCLRRHTLWDTPKDFANWKTLLWYIPVVSFISIAYVVVKFKILKVFYIDSASMEWPFLGLFGPLLPEILFDPAETLTRGSLH